MGNLSYRGFLGVTARNLDRNYKGVDVSIARVMNLNPNYYTSQFEADQMAADNKASQEPVSGSEKL